MKLKQKQFDALEAIQEENPDAPWGECCPHCNRSHLFTYKDGTKACAKCDELVVVGLGLGRHRLHGTLLALRLGQMK